MGARLFAAIAAISVLLCASVVTAGTAISRDPDLSTAGWSSLCRFQVNEQIDPIGAPGQPLSDHMHSFAGEPDPVPDLLPEDLRAMGTHPCNDTDLGGADGDHDGRPDGIQRDNSEYWMPALRSTAVSPTDWWSPARVLVYFRNAGVEPGTITPFDQNFSIKAGDSSAYVTPDGSHEQPPNVMQWSCVAKKHSGFDEHEQNFGPLIPRTCPMYLDPETKLYPYQLRLVVYLPNCFDPTNIADDGHMWTPLQPHYAEVDPTKEPPYNKTCSIYHGHPTTSYRPYPQVQIGYRWDLRTDEGITNDGTSWNLAALRLSSDHAANQYRGVTAHVDYMSGYSTAELTRLVNVCFYEPPSTGHYCH